MYLIFFITLWIWASIFLIGSWYNFTNWIEFKRVKPFSWYFGLATIATYFSLSCFIVAIPLRHLNLKWLFRSSSDLHFSCTSFFQRGVLLQSFAKNFRFCFYCLYGIFIFFVFLNYLVYIGPAIERSLLLSKNCVHCFW